MQYIYEFEIWRGESQWIAEAFDLPAAVTQGEDMRDVCESAADVLREVVRDSLMAGTPLPQPTFDNEPANGGVRAVVAVDVSLDEVERMTAAEAAEALGVSRGRVTAMLASKRLDGWREGRNTYVTRASVQARLADAPAPGRPRRVAAS